MSCGQMPLDGSQELVSGLPVPSPTRAALLHTAHSGRCPPLPPLLRRSLTQLCVLLLSVSFPLLFPLLSWIPSFSLFLSCESEGVVVFLDHRSASGTQHQMWHKWALSICRTNLSLLCL
ncbi:unnamed protein product [Rangifer tarandus platyrhynchus]|uniref:Uncharacterized protein n=1 Tax=Rangifer tarandus platyrhynchus TaxID=3082113 RepID=A0ABN8XT19_RANTA|nr:unnamed protein product [Rangifer tarandus platyrhynchus]